MSFFSEYMRTMEGMDMSRWNGAYFKGAAKQNREMKRQEAVTRNQGGSVMQPCGHKHGLLQVSRCEKGN
jgi:hypothetical protein